jgi:hypothetical protein
LAQVQYERNGVRLRGPHIGDLAFTGPGAGPEITAGTIIDDAVQIISEGNNLLPPSVSLGLNDRVVEPRQSPWFIRCALPEDEEASSVVGRVTNVFAQAGIGTRHVASLPDEGQQLVYLMTQPRLPSAVYTAVDQARRQLDASVTPFRAIDDD